MKALKKYRQYVGRVLGSCSLGVLCAMVPGTSFGLEVALESPQTSFKVGDSISLDVTVDAASSLYGVALDLTYDKDIVEVADADDQKAGVQTAPVSGSLLSGDGEDTILLAALSAQQQGRLVLGGVRSGQVPGIDVTTKGTLATLSFKAVRPGVVEIAYSAGKCTVQQADLSEIPIDLLSGITLQVDPFEGDVDGNGVIDLVDVITIMKVLTGVQLDGVTIYPAADVNSDSQLGIAEVMYNMQVLAGGN